VPAAIRTEALIAERVLSDVRQLNTLGSQVPYNCPNCGGVLWGVDHSGGLQYRCHTGHSFTTASLLTSQSEKIEETLWVALRMFEERKNLLTNTRQREASARRNNGMGNAPMKRTCTCSASETCCSRPSPLSRGRSSCRSNPNPLEARAIHAVRAIVTKGLNRDLIEPPQPRFLTTKKIPSSKTIHNRFNCPCFRECFSSCNAARVLAESD
jgi:hypothetical protein